MSTINPLFLDSTKPIGDKVVTNVEITNILLYDGDSLYFEITNEFGFSQRFTLNSVTTKKSVKYTAEVWLNYQHQIQYRFVLEADGQQLYASAKRETRAGHVISEKWEPCFDANVTDGKKDKKRSQRTDGVYISKNSIEIKTNTSKPLCKPQFFDQIKSLLDDLL
ncbi:MAG: hypothetical protein ACXVCP_11330 [Bdellovibrio sp.]